MQRSSGCVCSASTWPDRWDCCPRSCTTPGTLLHAVRRNTYCDIASPTIMSLLLIMVGICDVIDVFAASLTPQDSAGFRISISNGVIKILIVIVIAIMCLMCLFFTSHELTAYCYYCHSSVTVTSMNLIIIVIILANSTTFLLLLLLLLHCCCFYYSWYYYNY
jgi:hypothetical protein